MAQIREFESTTESYFILDGVSYPKVYEAMLDNGYSDTKIKLVGTNRDTTPLVFSTQYTNIRVDGDSFDTALEAISRLNQIVFSKGGGSGTGGATNVITEDSDTVAFTGNGKPATPLNAKATPKGESVLFSPIISFHKYLVTSTKLVDSDIIFTKNTTDSFIGSSTLVRLTADGIHNIDLSAFKKITGFQYDNIPGTVNCLYFLYDGIDYWVNSWQEDNTSADTTPPSQPVLSLLNTTENSTFLNWISSTDNVAVTGYSIFKNGVYLTTTTGNSFLVTGLSSNTNYSFNVRAIDNAGNVSSPSNTISATTLNFSPVIFDEFYGATYNSSTNVLTGATNTGAYKNAAQAISSNFCLVLSNNSHVAVLGLTTAKGSNMVYGTTSNYIYAMYRTNTSIEIVKGSARTLLLSRIGLSNYVRLRKDGVDAVFEASDNGISWTIILRDTNGLSAVTTAYIKGVFVASGQLNANTVTG